MPGRKAATTAAAPRQMIPTPKVRTEDSFDLGVKP
jgi:hypothetical protein